MTVCACMCTSTTQPAFLGPTVLPVPSGVSARLGCPVTMRRGGAGARLDSQDLAAKNVRMAKKKSISAR